MILKQVIRYDNAPVLEATWVEMVTLPMKEGSPDALPVTQEIIVKCRAYDGAQMEELAIDLGEDASKYQELMDEIAATWVSEETTEQIPTEVTMRQARLALVDAGMYGSIQSAINSLPEPMKTKALIEWEYSNTVQRHNGFVSQLRPILGMTEEDLDNLFIAASKL